jgi:hypothetical protein
VKVEPFAAGTIEQERTGMGMRRLILAGVILALAGGTEVSARGGSHGHSGGHSFGHSHGHHRHVDAQPANPSVPPSLTPDSRLTGAAPLPPHRQPRRGRAPIVSEQRHPDDVALDRKIRSICRGC